MRPINIVENLGVDDGIQATRELLSKCWFDREKTKDGVYALKNYHKEYDEKRDVYKSRPEHDWSSHASDAFRYLAVGQGQYKTKLSTNEKRDTILKNRINKNRFSATAY